MKKKFADIYSLLSPYFEKIYERLAKRQPPSADRIRKYKLLFDKICEYFKDTKTFTELDNPRLWREFHKHCSNRLSQDSLRVFTQDLNKVLGMLQMDGKIKTIKFKAVTRKFSSSEGFHVEELLNFTFEDIKKLWIIIKNDTNYIFPLMVMTVICTATPVNHLINLRVSELGCRSIYIDNSGLVYSVLLEPGRTCLFEYIVQKKLGGNDKVFSAINSRKFAIWLNRQCKKALIPTITAKKLFYFARFVWILQGVPAYQVACLGAKNAFSPFNKSIKGFLQK